MVSQRAMVLRMEAAAKWKETTRTTAKV